MAAQGFAKVTPKHANALVKRYRRLLGERSFWMKRRHHREAESSLIRVNETLGALATALPLVVPGIRPATLKPIRFELSVPLPGNKLVRLALASLRKLGAASSAEVARHLIEGHQIETELHSAAKLVQRVDRVLARLHDKGALALRPGSPPQWALLV